MTGSASSDCLVRWFCAKPAERTSERQGEGATSVCWVLLLCIVTSTIIVLQQPRLVLLICQNARMPDSVYSSAKLCASRADRECCA